MGDSTNNISLGINDDEGAIHQEWILMWGLNNLRQESLLCDITLLVNGKKLDPCHRAVLASSSPYFRSMFTLNVVEQNQPEVEINGISYDTLKVIVDYLYSGKIDINVENVQDLLTGSSVLQIAGLYGKTRRFMQRHLSIKNAVSVYIFAKRLCCEEIQNDAFSLIVKRFNDVIASDDFLELEKDDLVDFLSADELSIEKEETVYEATLSWLAHDIGKRGTAVGEIFSHVRLSLLDDNYLNDCIAKEEALMAFPKLKAQVVATQKYKREKDRIEKFISKKEKAQEENQTENQIEQTEDEVGQAVQDFVEFPFYLLEMGSRDVRIPLNTRPRAGMVAKSILLFTNGRKTILLDPTKDFYFCGGSADHNVDKNSTKQSLKSGIDTAMPEMKNPEVYATQNGTIYLIGGLDVIRTTTNALLRSKVFTFDVDRLKWFPKASLSEPRCMTGIGELNGFVYVTGGKALSSGDVLSCVHKYDDDEDMWVETQPMPVGVYGHVCASTKNKLFVFGGKIASKEIVGTVYFLETSSNQWTQGKNLNVPRFLSSATTLRTPLSSRKDSYLETIYVVGGVGDLGLLSSCETYNASKNESREVKPEFPEGRCAQILTSINGNLSVIGGHVTERSADGRFESKQRYDVYSLETNVLNDELNATWRKVTERIRGIDDFQCACVGFRFDQTRIGASSK